MGWARANLVFDLARDPPEPNTLREYVFLEVARHRTQTRISEVRATAQAALGGKDAEKAFIEYQNTLRRVDVQQQRANEKEILDAWIRHGPLLVQPAKPSSSQR